jgi:hypothetical protein
MSEKVEECVGFIALQFFDVSRNEIISLGGAGFTTRAEWDYAWQNIPNFEGETAFMADRLDNNSDTSGEKRIGFETCEMLLLRPIGELISEGRARQPRIFSQLAA